MGLQDAELSRKHFSENYLAWELHEKRASGGGHFQHIFFPCKKEKTKEAQHDAIEGEGGWNDI